MRAKYKVGQFIQTKDSEESPTTTGVIEAVVIRKEAVSYQLIGQDTEILEDDVAAVFRPVTPRKPKAAGEGKSKKSGKAVKAA